MKFEDNIMNKRYIKNSDYLKATRYHKIHHHLSITHYSFPLLYEQWTQTKQYRKASGKLIGNAKLEIQGHVLN